MYGPTPVTVKVCNEVGNKMNRQNMSLAAVCILGTRVALLLSAGCATPEAPWPDIPFIVLEERADQQVFERERRGLQPEVKEVLLLPIVEGCLCKGQRHLYALAGPIRVTPGKESVQGIMSSFNHGSQRAVRGIVLARDHMPVALQWGFNYHGEYDGEKVMLVEMPRLSPEQSAEAARIIVNELASGEIVTGPERTFEEGLAAEQILGSAGLRSPIVRTGSREYRNNFLLWPFDAGWRVTVCLSEGGLDMVRSELVPSDP